MKDLSPYEQIKFINDVIKDRKAKNQQTYFSVKLDRMGVQTPLVIKEDGDSLYETLLLYLTKYELSALLIDLYHAKSYNVKTPFQSFKINVKRSEAGLGTVESKNEPEVLQTETIISPEKHFYTIVEKERANILLEFRIKQLELEIETLTKKNRKKKKYIEELERELGRSEREKKNSIGNVTLGGVASNAIENFARSNFGIGILKNVFGVKQDVLNGLMGVDNSNDENALEAKSTATLVSTTPEPEIKTEEKKEPLSNNDKIRLQIIKYINDFLLKSDDGVLRLYYELVMILGNDINLLQNTYTQLKKQKQKTHASEEPLVSKTENKIESNDQADDNAEAIDDS